MLSSLLLDFIVLIALSKSFDDVNEERKWLLGYVEQDDGTIKQES